MNVKNGRAGGPRDWLALGREALLEAHRLLVAADDAIDALVEEAADALFQFFFGVQLYRGHRQSTFVNEAYDLVLQNMEPQHGFVQRNILFEANAAENLETPLNILTLARRHQDA